MFQMIESIWQLALNFPLWLREIPRKLKDLISAVIILEFEDMNHKHL